MGEYAKRKSDGVEIKIGTCEDMYYIRYEDRNKVIKLPNSLDAATEMDLRWRLPFPDEDNIAPGEYSDYKRGLRLFKLYSDPQGRECVQDFTYGLDNPGSIQLHHADSGLLLNVPCYHGMKLPEVGPGMTAFWNGKGHAFELSSIKNTAEGVLPIVCCRHCGEAWRLAWADVLPYVQDAEMRARLTKYAEIT